MTTRQITRTFRPNDGQGLAAAHRRRRQGSHHDAHALQVEGDDNDGIADAVDPFPLNPAESVDTDADGIGNNADTDDDGDGIPDSVDGYPLERDGLASRNLSRQIATNPRLRPILGPVRARLLALGL